ncbi:carbohydrate kinase [Aerococcus urinaehominis]|uniref:Carbohydrate kinase n=2 Tax=Aerococcus urinaehominis TaxID=128944 RepID=A0A109RH31_9LACT|nr:carbohydrate kinase [Aerococcus urinaehominis]
MMTDSKYVVVIGGLNMDIAGISGPIYRERDSNIGKVHMSPGGVGRNIAHNLTNLEVETHLITAYGDDNFGQLLKKSCAELNIDLSHAECLPGRRSSVYLYVTDDEGDMVTGVNDMGIVDEITPEFLSDKLDFINGADIVVLDANLKRKTLEWLGDKVTVPIFADPVSVAKAGRFADMLDKIHTIKPNEHEIELYTGIKVTSAEAAKEAAKTLIKLGVQRVFLSLGSQGMVVADRDNDPICVPVITTNVTSANGAGDCAMAAIAWSHTYYSDALPAIEVAQLACAASSLTLQTEASVSDKLNIRDLVKHAQNYQQ